MATSSPKFSWSPERDNRFNTCELCYLLYYYSAHQGWYNNRPVETRAAYRWKRAQTLTQLMHETVVEEMREAIYSDTPVSLKAVYQAIIDRLNSGFQSSLAEKEAWYQAPNKHTMLYELVYEDALDDARVKETQAQVSHFVKQLANMKVTQDLAQPGSRLCALEGTFKKGFPSYTDPELDVRVYARADIVYELPNHHIVVALIRTDDTPSSLSEIGATARLAAQTFKVPLAHVHVQDEFLITGTYNRYTMTPAMLRDTQAALADSVGMMEAFLVDKDRNRNEFIGFETAPYTRSRGHVQAGKDNCSMQNCPYCEAVKRDLALYPNGYDATKSVLKYKEK